MPAIGSERISAMAAAIYDNVNLDDSRDVALCLFAQGYLGRDIGDDLPAIIDAVRELRAKQNRNQITDIVTTVAAFGAIVICCLAPFQPMPAMARAYGGVEEPTMIFLAVAAVFGGLALALVVDALSSIGLARRCQRGRGQ